MTWPLIRGSVSVALATTAALSLVACGSSHAANNTAPLPSGGTSTSSTPTPTGSPMADAATSAAVKKAYSTFFNGTKHPAQAMAALQNGTKLAAVVAQAAKSPTAANISVTVSKVTLVNAHVANVTFTLYSKGFAVLSNTTGQAVLVNGTWQVAATTFCGLTAAEAGGKLPTACSRPGVMTLPSS